MGVFFGAILAIHLSTISSHLNLGALYFTRDIYQRYIKPDASEKRTGVDGPRRRPSCC